MNVMMALMVDVLPEAVSPQMMMFILFSRQIQR